MVNMMRATTTMTTAAAVVRRATAVPTRSMRCAALFAAPRRWRPQRRYLNISNRSLSTTRTMRVHSLSEEQRQMGLHSRDRDRVCGIWYIPSPATTHPSSIIPKLPQLLPEDRKVLNKALILVSPGLASWVDGTDANNTFLRDAMNWMYAPVLPSAPPTSYVAVVDGLPGPEYPENWQLRGVRPYSSAEGIAVCLLADVVSEERAASDVHEETGNGGLGLLRVVSDVSDVRIQSRQKEFVRARTSLTVPLANTLFVNGLRSTALKVQWKASAESRQLAPDGEASMLKLVQFVIPVPAKTAFDHKVPLYRLTARRKVISSMGNVVRQVEDDDGKPVGASKELEAVVPRFLAGIKSAGEEAEIQIFARVMPADWRDFKSQKGNRQDVQSATTSDDAETFKFVSYSDTYIAFWCKGQFYRVTSGGGGWGKKAGLLSLDPATNFELPKGPERSIFPDPEADEVMVNPKDDLEALVPADSTIEFFAVKLLQPYKPYYMAQSEESSENLTDLSRTAKDWSTQRSQRLLLGVIAEEQHLQSTNDMDKARNTSIETIPGYFGALSRGGASIRLEQANQQDPSQHGRNDMPRLAVKNEFRVDMPSAIFCSETIKAAWQPSQKNRLTFRRIVFRHDSSTQGDENVVRKVVEDRVPHVPKTGGKTLDPRIRLLKR